MKKKHFEQPTERSRLDKLVRRAKENLSNGLPPHAGFSSADAEALAERYSQFVSRRDSDGFLTAGEHVVTSLDTPRPYLHLSVSPV